VLLHLIDMLPPDPDADPVADAKAIVGELKKYDPELAAKPRWLVINKMDLLPAEEAKARATQIVRGLRFTGPVFLISGATGEGTRPLVEAVMQLLESIRAGQPPEVRGTFEVELPAAKVSKPKARAKAQAKATRKAKAKAKSRPKGVLKTKSRAKKAAAKSAARKTSARRMPARKK
jgi:GTP-binding protein